MNIRRSTTVLSLILVVSLAPASLEQDTHNHTEDRCVRLRNINGYNVIDDQHVVLRGGASRHYLVSTQRRCPDMEWGYAIGTSFGDNERICNAHFEYIIPQDGRWRCRIETIEEVESTDAARALIEQRAQDDDAESER